MLSRMALCTGRPVGACIGIFRVLAAYLVVDSADRNNIFNRNVAGYKRKTTSLNIISASAVWVASRIRLLACIATLGGFTAQTLLAGCSMVPPLSDVTGTSDSEIFVNDVVARVKCEVTLAFADKMEAYPWLDNWTVKADLSLQANEQGGISPSGSYTTYSRNAVNTAAGPASTTSSALGLVPQFFTFTASASYGEQAEVTDGQSFTLSLKELQAFHASAQFAETCDLPQRAGLTGNLRLREWVDTSLASVDARILLAGDHAAPNSGGAAKPQVVGKPSPIPGAGANLLENKTELKEKKEIEAPTGTQIQEMNNAVTRAKHAATDTASNLALVDDVRQQLDGNYKKAKTNLENYSPISPSATLKKLNAQIKTFSALLTETQKVESCALQQLCGPKYGDCSSFGGEAHSPGEKLVVCPAAPPCPSPENTKEIDGARQEAACTEQVRTKAENIKDKDKYQVELDLAKNEADAAANNDSNAKDLVTYAQALSKQTVYTPDSPIDSISYSAQFVVAIGGGITPSWTLLAWKGPGLTAPGISATGTRTHILQLALASPAAPTSSGAEQSRVLMNQLLLPH